MTEESAEHQEGRKETVETLVDIASFGFKYGSHEGDLVIDVRAIPNPYYVPDLRALTGRDKACADYIFSHESAAKLLGALIGLVEAMLGASRAKGRERLSVRIGCTGGQHRSVALAEALAATLGKGGNMVELRHLEIEAGRCG